MLLKDNKKGLVTIIMKRMKGGSSDMSPDFKKEHASVAPRKNGAEQDDSVALSSAAEEMISAIKSDDASKFTSALKSFIEMCEDKDED